MGNYSLVVNSKFNPVSFKDMWEPAMYLRQQQDALEEKYDQLDSDLSYFQKLANNSNDVEEYNKYKSISDDIIKARDSLMESGFNNVSKRELNKLRSRYRAEMIPIQEAMKAREADAALQREIDIKSGNRTIYTQDPMSLGVSAYMNGKRPNWGSTNLDITTTDMANLSKAISSRHIIQGENGKLFNGQYFDYLTKSGYTLDDAIEMMGQKDSEFGRAIQSIKDQIGYNNYNTNDQKSIDASLMKGLVLGTTYNEDHKPIGNQDHITPVQGHSMRIQDAQLNMEMSQMESKGYERDVNGNWSFTGNVPGNTIDISSKPMKIGDKDGVMLTKTADGKGFNVSDKDGNKIGFRTYSDVSKHFGVEGVGKKYENTNYMIKVPKTFEFNYDNKSNLVSSNSYDTPFKEGQKTNTFEGTPRRLEDLRMHVRNQLRKVTGNLSVEEFNNRYSIIMSTDSSKHSTKIHIIPKTHYNEKGANQEEEVNSDNTISTASKAKQIAESSGFADTDLNLLIQ